MNLKFFLPVLAALAILGGCGGGGGATVSGSFGPVYLTDSLSDYDHVWVTITRVTFHGQKGNVTAYNDPAGMAVDLASLRDSSGEVYAFLSTIPEGTYTGVTVVMKKDLVLVPDGATDGQPRQFAGNNGTSAVVMLNFGGPRAIGPNDPFAIDFDLANWDEDGTYVTGTPMLKVGNCNGIANIARHQKRSIRGVVQGLSGEGPGRTFTLVKGEKSFPVRFTQNTVVCGNQWLADGATVKIKGVFSPTEKVFVAWFVRVKKPSEGGGGEGGSGGEGELPQVEGLVFNLNDSFFTFDITISEARNFTPTSGVLHVQTSESTVFTDMSGATVTRAEFFASVQSEDNLEVTGPYNEGTNTMEAVRVGYAGVNGGG